MKHVRKIFAFALTLFMAFAVALPALAEGEDGTITINNAYNGEQYSAYKLFDAELGANNAILYKGTIPAGLTNYFQYYTMDSAGNKTIVNSIAEGKADVTYVEAKDDIDLSSTAAQNALRTWAGTATAADSKTGNGSAITLNVPLGYYVVKTSQTNSVISVDSTMPNVDINDKNDYVPAEDLTKKLVTKNADGTFTEAEDKSVNIGDTVYYKVECGTANFKGENKITQYIITDVFNAQAVSSPVLESITVTPNGSNTGTPVTGLAFVVNGNTATLTIPWVEGEQQTPKYANGSKLTVIYKATVLDTAPIAQGIVNKATVTFTDKDGNHTPDPDGDTETIFTYAFALQKVDGNNNKAHLGGAKFKLPFKVTGSNGIYMYAGADAAGQEVETSADGLLVVKGVKKGTYSIEETVAPAGYNKISAPFDVAATAVDSTTTITYDANGAQVGSETTNATTITVTAIQEVVNNKGTEMPSTGGIGTTIFYIVGGVMVAGAAIFLLTKRRAANAE